MSERPSESVLGWAADAVGAGAKVVAAKGLHEGEGRTGPWWLRVDHGGETSEVVLRVVVPGWIGEDMIATGAAALRFAEERGLAAPRLIAGDLDGREAGAAVTLEAAPCPEAAPCRRRSRPSACGKREPRSPGCTPFPSSLGKTCPCGPGRSRSTTTPWKGAGRPCTGLSQTAADPRSSTRYVS
jgi:hypothetical protein